MPTRAVKRMWWAGIKREQSEATVGYEGWGISEQPSSQAADVEGFRAPAQRMDKIFAS
jgi:hypothetical protein